jgi:hypothetical protein
MDWGGGGGGSTFVLLVWPLLLAALSRDPLATRRVLAAVVDHFLVFGLSRALHAAPRLAARSAAVLGRAARRTRGAGGSGADRGTRRASESKAEPEDDAHRPPPRDLPRTRTRAGSAPP